MADLRSYGFFVLFFISVKDKDDWRRSRTFAYVPWSSKDHPLLWKLDNSDSAAFYSSFCNKLDGFY